MWVCGNTVTKTKFATITFLHRLLIKIVVEYTWILGQGKNCQFSLLFPLLFISQIVDTVRGEGVG